MKFQENLLAILNKLGFATKAKQQDLTAADWNSVRTAYKKEFGVDFQAAQDEYLAEAQQQETDAQAATDNATAQSILSSVLAEVAPEAAANATPAATATVVETAQQAAAAMRQMANTVIPDQPTEVGSGSVSPNGPGHTATHFCGINHPLYSMDKRSNRLSVNKNVAVIEPVDEIRHGAELRSDLHTMSSLVSARIATLRDNNAMTVEALEAGVGVSIDSGGLGDQYLIRRTDAIIARLAKIYNVFDIYPRRSGVQDRDVMINAFLGDFSQAHQSGQVFKGDVELAAEFCYVDDVMFKTLFNSMKDIERQYIGYLNTSGSDPIKWSLIEWLMIQINQKLIIEQNRRKIMGVYVKPEKGEPGHFLNGGTGVFFTLLRYYNECKIARLSNPAFQSYSSGSTMVGVVTSILAELKAAGVDDLESMEVQLNENHRAMWIQGIREIYRNDTDFTGPQCNKVPDHNNVIRWIPEMRNLPLVIITQPGNIQSIEFVPGEMFNVKFDPDMETVRAWSVWKEGTAATYAGKKFENKAARVTNGYADQMIFTNLASKNIAADATTIDASSDCRLFITSQNTQATAITEITGAKRGFAYQIEIGSEVNPSTIAKAGQFADITAPFKPTKVGDYILVAPNADCTKFLELERCEAGARKINVALQPNVPGGR